jgi:hypothetical protein
MARPRKQTYVMSQYMDNVKEGYISNDADTQRNPAWKPIINKVKVKYSDYVSIHKALSKLSSVNLIIRSIADDKYDDLLSKLPIAYHDNVKKVAAIVVDYINKTEKMIREYYSRAPKDNRKEFMVWIDENVPKKYRGYCKELYLGKKINVIKSGNEKQPCYKKLKDMGVEDYSKIFAEE